jgi:hypothetical protein
MPAENQPSYKQEQITKECSFDEMARGIAEGTLTRGQLFKRMGRTLLGGLGAMAGISVVAAACSNTTNDQSVSTTGTPTSTTANPNELEIDGAYLCNQTYALCTTAPCEVSKTDPTIADCHCVVQNGYSIGSTPCAKRAQSGSKLISTFSTQNVTTGFYTMTCPDGTPWANCYNMVCTVDPLNPAQAICQCQLVKTGEYFTFGGGCDTGTCTSVIWSAATPDLPASTQYESGMKQLNQKVNDLPPNCPATSSTADSTQNRTTEASGH